MSGVYDNRLERVRSAMSDRGLDVLLVYSEDPWNNGNLRYLAGCDLYTNYSILTLPVDGEPSLVVEVPSPVHLGRVEAVSSVTHVSGGKDISRHMKNVLPLGYPAGKSVGVVGLGDPCEHMHHIFKDLLEGAVVTDFTTDLERIRMVKEDGEKELIDKALDLAGRCIEGMRVSMANGSTPLQVIADAELEAGLGGVELMDKRNVFVNLWDAETDTPHATDDLNAPLKKDGRLFTDIYLQFRGYWVHRVAVISGSGTGNVDYDSVEEVGSAVSDVLVSMSVGDSCPSVASAVDATLNGYGLEPCYPQTKAGIRGHGIGLDIRDPPRFGPSSPHNVCDGMVADLDIEVKLPGGGYHYGNFVFHVDAGKTKLV